MKVYIKDNQVLFYKYKIMGTDSESRAVTLYAKDDTDKTNKLTLITGGTATDISPTSNQLTKATEWQEISNKQNYNVEDAESYINAANNDTLVSTNLQIVSQNEATNRFVLDYNENEDSLDISYE